MTTTAPAAKLPYWVRGDTNAFFGFGVNVLVNVLTLTGLCIGVIGMDPGDVFGVILPALGIALVAGNMYYTHLARRLAARENRADVTALPYGPSVPHMFIVIFVIMLPIYLRTRDPIQAWTAGIFTTPMQSPVRVSTLTSTLTPKPKKALVSPRTQ